MRGKGGWRELEDRKDEEKERKGSLGRMKRKVYDEENERKVEGWKELEERKDKENERD